MTNHIVQSCPLTGSFLGSWFTKDDINVILVIIRFLKLFRRQVADTEDMIICKKNNQFIQLSDTSGQTCRKHRAEWWHCTCLYIQQHMLLLLLLLVVMHFPRREIVIWQQANVFNFYKLWINCSSQCWSEEVMFYKQYSINTFIKQ